MNQNFVNIMRMDFFAGAVELFLPCFTFYVSIYPNVLSQNSADKLFFRFLIVFKGNFFCCVKSLDDFFSGSIAQSAEENRS